MNIKLLFRYLLLTGTFTVGLNINNTALSKAQDATDALHVMYRDDLSFIKSQLETTKNALVEIRNSQNPALMKSAVSSLGVILKELVYIAGALTLGGGSVALGIGMILGPDTIKAIFSDPLAQGASLIALPAVIVSIIISYAFIKLVFDRLLAPPSNKTQADIKESLTLIDQTINKLNFTINTIERMSIKPL